MTGINYGLGLAIAAKPNLRKPIFVLAVTLDLSILVYYKYLSFFLRSLHEAVEWCAPQFNVPAVKFGAIPDLILPLGISFFVFEFIHYIVDVFKGSKPIRNFVNFAIFAAFFPSQIAGPIKRYEDFDAQLNKRSTFDGELFNSGLALTVQGLFKKVAIADNLATVVEKGFSSSLSVGTVDAWLAVVCFALQIYFDFSGYTDMGIGAARMLGFNLPPNFKLPYLANSLSDFWRRWHISLSTWLRDYLFIPLGGSRSGRLRTNANLLITMSLGGLWHGAAWHYIVWGVLHGISLIVVHEYEKIVAKNSMLTNFHLSLFGRISSISLTFIVVLIGWVFFRAENMPQANQMLTRMFFFETGNNLAFEFCLSLGCAALAVYALFSLIRIGIERLEKHGPSCSAALVKHFAHTEYRFVFLVTSFFASLAFAPAGSKAFIYFQF